MFFKSSMLALLTATTIIVDAAKISTLSSKHEHCTTKLGSTSHSGNIPTTTVTKTRTFTSTATKTATFTTAAATFSPTTLTKTKYTTVVASVPGSGRPTTDVTTSTSTIYTTVTEIAIETDDTCCDAAYTTTITDPHFDPVRSTLPTTAGAFQKRDIDDLQLRAPKSTYPVSVRCVSSVFKTTTITKTIFATKTTGTPKRSTVTSTITSTLKSTFTAMQSHAQTTLFTTITETGTTTSTSTTYSPEYISETETDYTLQPTSASYVCGPDNFISLVGGLRIVDFQGGYIDVNLQPDTSEYNTPQACCNACYLDYRCFGTIFGDYNTGSNRCGFANPHIDRLARRDDPDDYPHQYPPADGADLTAYVQQYNADGSIPSYYGQYGNFTISNGIALGFTSLEVLSADCCPPFS